MAPKTKEAPHQEKVGNGKKNEGGERRIVITPSGLFEPIHSLGEAAQLNGAHRDLVGNVQ